MDELEYLYVLISDSVEDSIILDNARMLQYFHLKTHVQRF